MSEIHYGKYLPLSEATFYVLVSLTEPLHGYAIMQKVETTSKGNVVIGPGTMYGAFNTLVKQGLIAMIKEEDRRKYYALTETGKLVLEEQIRRIEVMYENGKQALVAMQTTNAHGERK